MRAGTGDAVAALATTQGGHVTRRQLLAAGWSDSLIRRRVAAGALLPVHRGVYALGHRPAEPVDVARGALLAVGPRAVLHRGSAGAYWGIMSRWPEVVEIAAPTQHRTLDGLRVRTVRTLRRRDVTVARGLRVTTPARTVLDLAPLLSDRALIRGIEDLRHRRLLTVADLVDVAAWNSSQPDRARVLEAVGQRQAEPTRSELEDGFLRLLHRQGLPTPQVNVHVAGYRVDMYFPEHALIVELDGWMTHQSRQAFARDRRQDAEILARTGISTVRFTHDQTVRTPAQTARHLTALLDRAALRRRTG